MYTGRCMRILHSSKMSQTVKFGWIYILGFLFAIVVYVQCSCTVTPAKIETTYTGRVRHYCVHNVTNGNSTVQIDLLLDSKFETRDCQRCTCTRMGLSCCGYGVASNEPIHVPEGCHPVEDGCRIALISNIDNVTDCYSIGPAAAERRQQEMMKDMARRMAHQQYPQAMQYWRGLNPPRIHPMAALFGAGRRGPNGRPVEQPEGLMESFLLMSMFGGGGMGMGGSGGPGTASPGDPIGHMGDGGQSMGGLGLGGMGGSFMESPLGMSLLFSSFMS